MQCSVLDSARHKGSISAEHGLGFKKAQYIYHSKSREAVQWMKHVKKLFDPNVRCDNYVSTVVFIASNVHVHHA